MNIVIITILLPYPLDSGGAQAQYNMINQLRHKYNLTIIYPVNSQNSISSQRELQKLWPEVKFRPYNYIRQLLYLPFLKDKIYRAFQLKFMPNRRDFKVYRILKPYGYPLTNDFKKFVLNIIKKENIDIAQVEFYPYLDLVDSLPASIKKIFIHHEIRFMRNERMLSIFELS